MMTRDGSERRTTRTLAARIGTGIGAGAVMLVLASSALAGTSPPPVLVNQSARTVRVHSLVREGSTVRVTLDCTASGSVGLRARNGKTVHPPQSFACEPDGSATSTFRLSASELRRARNQVLHVTYTLTSQLGS
jgi:hypothetical protein